VFPAPVVPFIREADFAIRPPWSMPDRRLLDYLLVGVDAGVVRLTVDGAAHQLAPGDFALVQPRELHNFDAPVSTTTPYIHLDVFYNARRNESVAIPGGRIDLTGYEHLIQPRLNDLPGIQIPSRFLPSDERFRETLMHTVTLAQSADPFDMLEAQAGATELIAMILRDFTAPAREARPASSLHWMTSYMSLRLGEQMTVDDLAARAHLSPSRFAAIFRRQFGTSPHAYLTSLRIEHACSLLDRGDTGRDSAPLRLRRRTALQQDIPASDRIHSG
jgi:AraC-like DNA-binding protein